MPRRWYCSRRWLSSVSTRSPGRGGPSVRTKAAGGDGSDPDPAHQLVGELAVGRLALHRRRCTGSSRSPPRHATARANAVPASAGSGGTSSRASALSSNMCDAGRRNSRWAGGWSHRQPQNGQAGLLIACSHAAFLAAILVSRGDRRLDARPASRFWISPNTPCDDAKTSRLTLEMPPSRSRFRVASTLTRRARSGAFSGATIAARCTTASAPSSAAPSDAGSVMSPRRGVRARRAARRLRAPSAIRGRRRQHRGLRRAARAPCVRRYCPTHPSRHLHS